MCLSKEASPRALLGMILSRGWHLWGGFSVVLFVVSEIFFFFFLFCSGNSGLCLL